MSVCYGFEARKRTEKFLAAMKARAKTAAAKYKEAELSMGIRTVADLERHDAYNASRRANRNGYHKERQARLKADPEKYEESLARNRERRRERRARLKADPEKYEAFLARNREQAQTRRNRLKADPEKYEENKAKRREQARARRNRKKEAGNGEY